MDSVFLQFGREVLPKAPGDYMMTSDFIILTTHHTDVGFLSGGVWMVGTISTFRFKKQPECGGVLGNNFAQIPVKIPTDLLIAGPTKCLTVWSGDDTVAVKRRCS
jgi:hypothetical protein